MSKHSRSVARSPRKNRKKISRSVPTINPNTAGVDIGATEIYVAVPADRDPDSVRSFGTFTEDLHALAAWLKACGVTSVAMESTSVYWIPLFLLLEEQGFEVCLVNARHVKNVPGRKTDVVDCQWLQYLHSVGLLRGSFHPPEAVSAVRSVLRHRGSLVRMAASHIQHMQKALTQMNLHLHHVISDITGKTGLLILDAILAGERDPATLAQRRDSRVRASQETIAKALVGTWRREHLFTLRQSLCAYRNYQDQINQCDREIQEMLSHFSSQADPREQPLPPRSRTSSPTHGGLGFDLRTEMYRILGTDLTAIPGLEAATVHTLFSELGRDLSAFRTCGHFCSWLGLCPDNRISGGKILSVGTRKVKHRAATALRLAAQTLHRSDSPLGEFYRRMRARLGAPKAITATAHKLARLIYYLITTGKAYDETVFAHSEHRHQQRRARRLQTQAAAMGYRLVPVAAQ
jgi:transposase